MPPTTDARSRGATRGTQPAQPPLADFETIDWVRDLQKDHNRMRALREDSNLTSWMALYEASQSWLLVSLVGVSLGVLVSCIDIVTAWLTDFRLGYCKSEWYLPRDICCAGYSDNDSCIHWIEWSEALGVHWFVVMDWVFYIVLSVAFAMAAALLVVTLAPQAAGSGTAEIKTILGGFVIDNFLSLRTFVVKAIALPLTVASGLAVGKEGPMIHVACCVGFIFPMLFSKYAKNEARKREILSAAAAAGVGVAFGAPIGGVLFSMEELSSFFPSKTMIRSFFCALASCVTLQFIDPFRGKRVLFAVTTFRNWHFFEIIFFVLLGIFGGLFGAFLIKLTSWVRKKRSNHWIRDYPIREVAAVAMITAAIGYLNAFTRIDGSELLEVMFKECDESNYNNVCSKSQTSWNITLLVFALLFKMVMTVVSLGISVPAGVFIPSMVCGSLFGRIVGILVESWQQAQPNLPVFDVCHPDKPCVTPGTYALLGSIATLGGVTRMTVSLTVIMFELTGTLDYIIPCMIILMIARMVGDAFGKGGTSDTQIREKGYPFLDGASDEVIGRPAYEIMTYKSDLAIFEAVGMTVGDVEQLLAAKPVRGFPVLKSTETGLFAGYASRALVERTIMKARNSLSSFSPGLPVVFASGKKVGVEGRPLPTPPYLVIQMSQAVFSVQPQAEIELVIDLFRKLGPRYLIVLDGDRLAGLITKKDLLNSLRQHSVQFEPQLETRSFDFEATVPLMEQESNMVFSRQRGGFNLKPVRST